MLNILKWDFINYIKRRYWIYLGFAAAFILAALPDSLPVAPVFDGLATGYGVFFYFFTAIFSIIVPIGWLRKSPAQLELSVPAKPWKKLLGKLVLSACIITSTLFLGELLWAQLGRSGLPASIFTSGASLIQSLLFMLTIAATIMFSYITAKSFAPTRKIAGLITFLIFIGIYALIVYLAFIPINFTIRQAEITTIYNQSYLINTPNQEWFTILSLICPAGLIAVFFFISSFLLKKRFERY